MRVCMCVGVRACVGAYAYFASCAHLYACMRASIEVNISTECVKMTHYSGLCQLEIDVHYLCDVFHRDISRVLVTCHIANQHFANCLAKPHPDRIEEVGVVLL